MYGRMATRQLRRALPSFEVMLWGSAPRLASAELNIASAICFRLFSDERSWALVGPDGVSSARAIVPPIIPAAATRPIVEIRSIVHLQGQGSGLAVWQPGNLSPIRHPLNIIRTSPSVAASLIWI